MLTTIAALAIAFPPPTLSTLELYPIEDIWAYPHASEPDSDPFLRIWGYEGASVAGNAADSESFGYSLLKFDLAGLPVKALKGATLILSHTPKPAFTLEQAKQNPVEARPVNAGFTEKKWNYGDLNKFMPASGKEAVFGTGAPSAIDEEKDFKIVIDLLKGPNSMSKAIEAAKPTGFFAIALTTTLSPSEEARSIYKVYSKDGPKDMRPVLKLEFED